LWELEIESTLVDTSSQETIIEISELFLDVDETFFVAALVPDQFSVFSFTFVMGCLKFDLLFSLDVDLEIISLDLSVGLDENFSVDPFSG